MIRENNLKIMMIYGWGENPYADCVVRALKEKGVDIVLVTRENLGWKERDQSYPIYKIFPGHRNQRSYLLLWILQCVALIKLIRLFFNVRPSLVHFQSFRIIKIDWILLLFFKLLKIKTIFTIHDTHSHRGSSIDDFIMKKVSQYCDAIFVHTNYSKNIIHNKWELPNEKIWVVSHGGYYSYYGNVIHRKDARKTLGYQESDFIILFFGVIRKSKGLDYLLLAIAEAKKTISNLKLIISGKSYNEDLSKYYKELIIDTDLLNEVNLQDRFIRDDEVATLFCCCDLVALPYIEIDQSGVLFLSFTFAKPVIATNIGGLQEIVHNGINGYTIPPMNTQALTERIIEAWEHRCSLDEMGLRAQKFMDEECNWSRLADSTIEVYIKLLC
jgi:glycosyltransferase involved in cell wall biosynthesis